MLPSRSSRHRSLHRSSSSSIFHRFFACRTNAKYRTRGARVDHGRDGAVPLRQGNRIQNQLVSTEGAFHGMNPPALPVTGKGPRTCRVFLRHDRTAPPLRLGEISRRRMQVMEPDGTSFTGASGQRSVSNLFAAASRTDTALRTRRCRTCATRGPRHPSRHAAGKPAVPERTRPDRHARG